ncbi:MAG: transcription antitermination factor NusB [Bacteroidota bacterium]
MLTRRQIREKVMQAVYACQVSGERPETMFDLLLKEVFLELKELEEKKKLTGDTKLLETLYYDSMSHSAQYDKMIMSKAENWELDRIAIIDRILMHMAICEMLNMENIPVKVTINEYLELAKLYSTPKSNKFINGILDSLYNELHASGKIVKSGRGLQQGSSKKFR